jgi:hypothetical protein
MNNSAQNAAKYAARRRVADHAMIENLKTRCARIDRAAVEEEELKEHPLLAGTSVMHYLSAPSGPHDFVGYKQKLDDWNRAMTEHAASIEEGARAPFIFDVHKHVTSMKAFEYIWAAREAFSELIIHEAGHDLIGYWYRASLSLMQEALLGFATTTKGGILLWDAPTVEHTLVFGYAQLDEPRSRLAAVFKLLEGQYLAPTFYLMEFEPHHVEKIRARFPTSRIIGVTCPAPDVEATCLALLEKRQAAASASAGGAAAPEDPAERHRAKYGEDWLDMETSTKRTGAKGAPKKK